MADDKGVSEEGNVAEEGGLNGFGENKLPRSGDQDLCGGWQGGAEWSDTPT